MVGKKILAVKLRDLGDTALWTHALGALNQALPDSQLDVLVPRLSEPILRHAPGIANVWTVDSNRPLPVFRQLLKLRSQHYDLALGFHVNSSFARMAPLLGAKQIALHHHSWKYNPRAATLKVPRPGNLENAVSRDFQLLEAAGLGKPPIPKPPFIHLTNEEIRWADEQLNPHIGNGPQKKWAVLLPGARTQTRRYPLDQWLKLLDDFPNQSFAPPMIPMVCVDSELSANWNLKEVCRSRQIPLFDQLSLRQFIALLSRGTVAVGNDSGPIHIATALGLRTITLFGPGSLGDFHPFDDAGHIALRAQVPCRILGPRDNIPFQYCSLDTCGHLTCLRSLSPQSVLAGLDQLLRGEPQLKN